MPDCPTPRCPSPQTIFLNAAATSFWLLYAAVPGACASFFVFLTGWAFAAQDARSRNQQATDINAERMQQAAINMTDRAAQDYCGARYAAYYDYTGKCFFPSMVAAGDAANTSLLDSTFEASLHCGYTLTYPTDVRLVRLCSDLTEIVENCLADLQDEGQEAIFTWPIITTVLAFLLVTLPLTLCCMREHNIIRSTNDKAPLLA